MENKHENHSYPNFIELSSQGIESNVPNPIPRRVRIAGKDKKILFSEGISLRKALDFHRNIVLLGEAGLGKTELLNSFFKEIKREWGVYLIRLKGQNSFHIPMFKNAASFTSRLLIFDGLDECSDMSKILDDLQKAAENYPDYKFLISCRENIFEKDSLNGFTEFALLPLSKFDVIEYVKFRLKNKSDVFLSRFKDAQFSILVNPFYLINTITYFDKNNALPKSNSDLFNFLIKGALSIRIKKNSTTDSFEELIIESISTLQRLAFIMSCSSKSFIKDNEVKKIISDSSNWDTIVKKSSLLEHSFDSWTFSNQQFLEYFTACALSEFGDFNKIKDIIGDPPDREQINPRWVNTLGFLLEKIKEKTSEFQAKFKEWLLKNVNILIQLERKTFSESERWDIFEQILGSEEWQIKIDREEYFRSSLATFIFDVDDALLKLCEKTNSSDSTKSKIRLLFIIYSLPKSTLYEKANQIFLTLLLHFINEESDPNIYKLSILNFFKHLDHLQPEKEELDKIINYSLQQKIGLVYLPAIEYINEHGLQEEYLSKLLNLFSSYEGYTRNVNLHGRNILVTCLINNEESEYFITLFKAYIDQYPRSEDDLLPKMLEKIGQFDDSIIKEIILLAGYQILDYLDRWDSHSEDIKPHSFICNDFIIKLLTDFWLNSAKLPYFWSVRFFLNENTLLKIVLKFIKDQRHESHYKTLIRYAYEKGDSFANKVVNTINECTGFKFKWPDVLYLNSQPDITSELPFKIDSLEPCLDKNVFKKMVTDILAVIGTDSITSNMQENYDRENLEKLHDNFPFKWILWIQNIGTFSKANLIAYIDENWENISIGAFFERYRYSSLKVLKSPYRSYLESWCLNYEQKFDPEKSLNDLDTYFVFFTICLQLKSFYEKTYLKMIGYNFEFSFHIDYANLIQRLINEKYLGVLSYETVKKQMLNCLRKDKALAPAELSTFLVVINEYKMNDAIPFLEKLLSQRCEPLMETAKTYYNLPDSKSQVLLTLLENMDFETEHEYELIDFLFTLKASGLEECLLKKFSNTENSNAKYKYSKYLAYLGNSEGFGYFLNRIHEFDEFSLPRLESYEHFVNPELIHFVLELYMQLPKDSFIDILSSPRSMLLNLAKTENFKYHDRVIAEIELIISQDNHNTDDLTYLKWKLYNLRDSLNEQYSFLLQPSIEEAINIYERRFSPGRSHPIVSSIRDLLAQSSTKDALEVALQYTIENHNDKMTKDINLLKSRWTKIVVSEMRSTISAEDCDITKTQIEEELLNLFYDG